MLAASAFGASGNASASAGGFAGTGATVGAAGEAVGVDIGGSSQPARQSSKATAAILMATPRCGDVV